MSKGGFMKDAMILFAITLVSGACLGGVYEITKAPIAAAEMAAKAEAYKTVLPAAETFEEAGSADALAAANTEISGLGYGNVTVDEAVSGKDASGAEVGYVVTSTSKDGYGGAITVSVGIEADGTVSGIEFLTLAETAGLGMRAKEPSFYNQFAGQQAEKFYVSKDGGDGQPIDALSGATITSRAVTGAVNTALGYYQTALGGSGNE